MGLNPQYGCPAHAPSGSSLELALAASPLKTCVVGGMVHHLHAQEESQGKAHRLGFCLSQVPKGEALGAPGEQSLSQLEMVPEMEHITQVLNIPLATAFNYGQGGYHRISAAEEALNSHVTVQRTHIGTLRRAHKCSQVVEECTLSSMPSQRELDHEFRLRKWQIIQNLVNGFLRTICWVGPFVFIWLSVRDLAGRTTNADIAFKALADLKMNRYLAHLFPWGVGTLASGWALLERGARKRHIKRAASENSKLQKKLDPGRRSSSLTEKGDTSPEDV